MGLTDSEKRIVHALGQTMFPRDRIIDLDADDVNAVGWVEEYVRTMPPFAQAQIKALLRTFDLGFGAWAARPGATFTKANPADQAAYLESWEQATTYAQRQLYEAIRAMMTFSYADSAEVLAIIRPQPAAPAQPTNDPGEAH